MLKIWELRARCTVHVLVRHCYGKDPNPPQSFYGQDGQFTATCLGVILAIFKGCFVPLQLTVN